MKIKMIIPFLIARNMKYLCIKLIKYIQGFYALQHKVLMKEIKEILSYRKGILCLLIRRLNIMKMSVLHKFICRFIAVSIKIPARPFVNI